MATSELKSMLEREVQQVIDAARQRAAAIELEAQRRAKEIERGADDLAIAASKRQADVSSVLEGIERLERTLRDLLGPLRAEVERLAASTTPSLWPNRIEENLGLRRADVDRGR
jgi:hypothetical protein